MRGLTFNVSVPQYLLANSLGKKFPTLQYGRLSSLSVREVEPPRLPGGDWVRLRSIQSGMCGSDLATIFYKMSAYQQPFYSFPAVLGHEILGEIVEVGPDVRGFGVGERVTVNPVLPCRLRRLPLCIQCQRGNEAACENTAEGHFAPSILIGFSKDLPGGMGDELVAHQSQLFKIPDALTDDQAVLTEPLSVCLHAVLRHPPKQDDKVLVIGGGPIGFGVLWALRAMGHRSHVTLMTVESYQLELAKKLGADEVFRAMPDPAETEEVARRTGGRMYRPDLGPPSLQGGYETVYDCVGSQLSVADSLRYTRACGTMVLIGGAGILKQIDWTPVWARELTVGGSFTYGWEDVRGERKHTFQATLDLIRAGEGPDPGVMVTHHFALEEYQQAIEANLMRGKHRSIKTVFDLRKKKDGAS